MEKKTKVIIGIVSGVAAIGLGFAVYKRVTKPETVEQEDETIVETTTNVINDAVSTVTDVFVSPCSKNPKFPIKKGQKSKGVKNVQIFINRFGKLPNKIKEDCDFGSKTEEAARLGFRNVGLAYGLGINEKTYKDVILRALNTGRMPNPNSSDGWR